MARKPSVFVLGTGGTITAKKVDGKWEPGAYSTEELFGRIEKLAQVADVVVQDVFRMDSSNITPEQWLTIAKSAYSQLKKFDGVVIAHGTDTMPFTASALSFLIQKLDKPIVFTGSQYPPDQIGSDALENALDAVRVAAEADVAEAVIVFAGKILRGNRCKKVTEIDLDAFQSVGVPPLGSILQDISMAGHQTKRGICSPQLTAENLESSVSLLTAHPGMNPGIIDYLVERRVRGIVLEAFGGGIPTAKGSLLPGIRNAVNEGIPVILTAKSAVGANWINDYEVRDKMLKAGMIHCPNIISETALTKLMWVLGQTEDMEKVKEMMQTDYVGELTPLRG